MSAITTITLPPVFAMQFRKTIECAWRSVQPRNWEEKLVLAHDLGEEMLRHAPELAGPMRQLREPGGLDALLLDGVPVDDTTDGALVSLALADALGVPYQYLPQPDDNRLVARLEPKPHLQSAPNTGQSDGDFSPHNDWSAVAPTFSPGWLVMLGIGNQARAWTGITPLNPIVPQLAAITWSRCKKRTSSCQRRSTSRRT